MDTLRDILTRIQTDASSALSLLPPVSTSVVVKAGDSLQAALDKGGSVSLDAGAVFEGSFIMKVPGTVLNGGASAIHGTIGPALTIPPGTKNVSASLMKATTAWDQAVIQVGDNDPAVQSHLTDQPTAVTLSISVPTHRGKRAFYINGQNVSLLNCNALDVYDPAQRDSQGVLILNSAGDIRISGGTFVAGSENILLGGDVTGIPGIVPNNVIVEDVELSRPLAWQTDGIHRVVKNLFEVKSGTNVTLRRAKLSGCWIDGQSGYALMVTPRDGKTVGSLLFEDVTITNVGTLLGMIGYDNIQAGPQVIGVTLRRVNGTASKQFGVGRGFQWEGAPANVVLDTCSFEGPDNTVYVNAGTVWTYGVKSMDVATPGVSITGCQLACRGYGIMTNGFAYGLHWDQAFPGGVIANNTFFGENALQMAKNLPATNIFKAA